MPAVSQEELDKLRKENEALRNKIPEVEGLQAEREAERTREIEYTQAQAENIRLKAQLERAKAASKVGNVKEGSSGPLSAAKEQLQQAKLLADAPVGPVDTNSQTKSNSGTDPEVAAPGEGAENGGKG